jgi:hypothetical protein
MKTALIIALILAGHANPSLGEEKESEKSSEMCCSHPMGEPRDFHAQLNELKGKLKLTAEQEPLWKAWTAQFQKAHQVMEDFRKGEEARRSLPAPERQEKWMSAMEEHVGKMRASLPDLKSFYGALNDGQKKTFDAEVPFKRGSH